MAGAGGTLGSRTHPVWLHGARLAVQRRREAAGGREAGGGAEWLRSVWTDLTGKNNSSKVPLSAVGMSPQTRQASQGHRTLYRAVRDSLQGTEGTQLRPTEGGWRVISQSL